MSRKQAPAEEPEEHSSRAAGACVLVVLGGALMAVAFAIDEAAGVLLVVVAGAVALWRSARRVSDSSATPPPEEWRPSCRECADHELLSVAPLEGQEGMWIYKTAAPNRPNHTHTHVVQEEVSTDDPTPPRRPRLRVLRRMRMVD